MILSERETHGVANAWGEEIYNSFIERREKYSYTGDEKIIETLKKLPLLYEKGNFEEVKNVCYYLYEALSRFLMEEPIDQKVERMKKANTW